ncbi:Hok/Gef family protein, partial [Escherichia coli]|uniref:Hok/Gef family protein n=1 Tax=Escherichia coli TaxID=562 RepID=UPI003D9E4332
MMHFSTTDCSLFFAKMSKFMTKYTLIGLLAVCATVLCFSLIFREQLCELIRRQLVLPTRANYTGRTLQCDIKS